MEFSRHAEKISAGIFAVLNEKKRKLEQEGRKTYDFSIGTPDFPPPDHIINALVQAARVPENYRYAINDTPELTKAVQDYFERRFSVRLEPDEIMSVSGSQEGIAHIGLALFNHGDAVLVPDPGYPIFTQGPALCGAEIMTYPLYPENHFLPDFDSLAGAADRAKAMIVSYPANPLGIGAPDSFYEELIAFARRHNILIIHDNAYSDIIFGDRKGRSFLSYPGAREVGIEFYSLSKTFNLTGARISFAVGNREVIANFRKIRSQIDYGIFLPVQAAAAAALNGPDDTVKAQCREYERRNTALCEGLSAIGWKVPKSEGTMFVWAPVPEGFASSEEFVLELMERSGVIVVPGSSFGRCGEGYVRLALVHDVPVIEAMIAAVKESKLLEAGK